MPGTTSLSEPSVTLSFANNFWGKEDAGVGPMLQRMHDAKTTCEELKSFYTIRHQIEDEYSRRMIALSRKPFGSCESGSLKASMDVLRAEVESMGKAHQSIAQQFKTECEEPLSDFAGAMRERRKIVQNGIEKLLKLKMQQTQQVNKTRDRYETDCLRIKGYLAQGHMVMGQEERKNKAKLEKAQIQLAASNAEYENAIKALEETTARWNRDWKLACDKFQDLEEERIDYLKSSMWTFANIASTVCLSDDTSCEKVRLSLENCEVEKDITSFIRDRGTGQEIPDAPKYINFCRGDISDDGASEAPEDGYSVAQFQRQGNPAYRSSSPNPSNPSTYQSQSPLAIEDDDDEEEEKTPKKSRAVARKEKSQKSLSRRDREREHEEQLALEEEQRPRQIEAKRQKPRKSLTFDDSRTTPTKERTPTRPAASRVQTMPPQIAAVPHNEYPPDGMTMYCRAQPSSDRSSASSPARPPSSHASGSDYSSATSVSSGSSYNAPPVNNRNMRGLPAAAPSPTPTNAQIARREEEQQVEKKKSFFNSPFRRTKSKTDKAQRENLRQNAAMVAQQNAAANRQTWSPQVAQAQIAQAPAQQNYASANKRQSVQQTPSYQSQAPPQIQQAPSYNSPSQIGQPRSQPALTYGQDHDSPAPMDPRATMALNVGGNVFDVSLPEYGQQLSQSPTKQQQQQEEEADRDDPIAQALANLKAAGSRNSADRFYGLQTPAPPATPGPPGTSHSNKIAPLQPLTTASASPVAPSPLRQSAIQQSAVQAAMRGTPPPQYVPKRATLGAPAPAHTAAEMQRATQKYVGETRYMLESPPQMPAVSNQLSRQDSNHSMGSTRERAKTMDYNRADSRQSFQSMRNNSIDDPCSYQVARSHSPAPPSQAARAPSPAPTMRSNTAPDLSHIPPSLRAASPAPTQRSAQIMRSPSPAQMQNNEIAPLRSPSPAPPSPAPSRPFSRRAETASPALTQRSAAPSSYRGAPTPRPFNDRGNSTPVQQYHHERTNSTPAPLQIQHRNAPSPQPQPIVPRAVSPAPPPSNRSVSPRPSVFGDREERYAPSPKPMSSSPQEYAAPPQQQQQQLEYQRSASPAPFAIQARQMSRPTTRQETRPGTAATNQTRPGTAATNQIKKERPTSQYQAYSRAPSPLPPRATSPMPMQRSPSPMPMQRAASPMPQQRSPSPMPQHARSPSPMPNRSPSPMPPRSHSPMPMSSNAIAAIAPYAAHSRTHSPAPSTATRSSYDRRTMDSKSSLGHYPDNASTRQSIYAESSPGGSQRPRSKSVVDLTRQFNNNGRPILHHSRALFSYTAAIPEELTFQKGDILAVLRLQDDGWWEAEIVGVPGRSGLVPSNYLQNC